MKRIVKWSLIAVVLSVLARPGAAADPAIVTFNSDGYMSFEGFLAGTTARVQWVSSMEDPARTNWQDWVSIVVTSPTTRVAWPRFFRVVGTPDSEIPTNGLVAHYPFDGGTAVDVVGTNHGAIVGAVTTTDPRGQAAKALSFDGNDYVEMLTALPNMTSCTFSVWVRVSQWSSNEQTILIEGDSSPGLDIMLQFAIGGSLYFPTKSTPGLVVGGSPVPLSQWRHVVATADGVGGTKAFWVNGAMVGSTNMTGPACVGNHYRLQVGRLADGFLSTDFFLGDIDDLRIYNRALTPAEIQKLYLATP